MRESIHALRCDLLCLQDTQSERTWSELQSWSAAPYISNAHIYACAQLIDRLGHATRSATAPVSRSRTQSFQEKALNRFSGSRSSEDGIAHGQPRCL